VPILLSIEQQQQTLLLGLYCANSSYSSFSSMKAKKGASSPIYLFWEKKPKKKKKKAPPPLSTLLLLSEHDLYNPFWCFVFWEKFVLFSSLGTLKSPMLTLTCYKEKTRLLVYQQPSEHLERCAEYETSQKANSYPHSVTVFTILQTHPYKWNLDSK